MEEREIIDEIGLYARIDEDVGEIKSLKEAVEIYLQNAGIEKNYMNSLYFLLVKMLCKHWHDNRDLITTKTEEIPFGATSIINQLQVMNLGDINATQ